MKKIYQLFIISFAALLLAGCNNSKTTEIDPNTWTSSEGLSVEKTFNQQVEETQYIKDLEDFLSYNVLLTTEDKPFVSDVSLTADFDEKSSIQGGVAFSENKYSKSHDLEDIEIEFDVRAEEAQGDLEPVYASGSLLLVYQNDEMYANIHNFGIFMGEDDMLAKMYTLLGDSLVDRWIDLEVHSGGVIVLNEKEDIKLQYILGTLKSVLKTEGINGDSPNFLNGVVELIDTVNFRIDLGISTDDLSLQSNSVKYFELENGIIQKEFSGSFQGSKSAFDLSFIASKQGLEVRVYNIKRYDENVMNYVDTDYEICFLIHENSKSDYSIKFQSLQSKQAVVDIDGNLKYNNEAKFSGKFMLEPEGLTEGQKISGKIEGKVVKKSPTGDEIFHEVLGETVSLSSILSSL